jgi:hypothetical protein
VIIRILDARSVGRATDDPIAWRGAGGQRMPVVDGTVRLELGPYGVARLRAVP